MALNKELLNGLAKSNPEQIDTIEIRKIHKTLIEIINDKDLMNAVSKYGHTIKFAKEHDHKYSPSEGYRHLELDPKKGPLIVIAESMPMSDHNEDTPYLLYIRKNKVYFKGEEDKEFDAGLIIRDSRIEGNDDYRTNKQTAEYITHTLEEAIKSKIYKE